MELVVLVVALVLLFVGARVLQARWGLDTTAAVVPYAGSLLLPAPTTSGSAVLRRIRRLLPGTNVITARGVKGAAVKLTVRASPESLRALDATVPLDVLTGELASVYLRHASSEKWALPTVDPSVTFLEDVRMRPGWVRIDSIMGAYPTVAHGGQGAARAADAIDRGAGRGTGPVADTHLYATDLDDSTALEAGTRLRWRMTPVEGSVVAREFAVMDSVVVGRQLPADVVVADAKVSRRHCELTPTPTGLLVRDVGSQNGTWVRGVQLGHGEQSELKPGDELSLGRTGPAYRLAASGA